MDWGNTMFGIIMCTAPYRSYYLKLTVISSINQPENIISATHNFYLVDFSYL